MNQNKSKMEKKTNGTGCVDVINEMITELKKHPAVDGADKESWVTAGVFLNDYLQELSYEDIKKIAKHLGMPDLFPQHVYNDDIKSTIAAAMMIKIIKIVQDS